MPLPAALSDATLPLPHKPIITVNPTSHSRSSTSDSGISSASSSVDPAPSPKATSAAQPASASLSLIGRLRAFLVSRCTLLFGPLRENTHFPFRSA